MSARPSSLRRSSTTERLPRLSRSNGGLTMSPRAPPVTWSILLNGSPPGASTLMTSAPQSASTPPAAGPATHTPSSTTRTPSSMGPVLARASDGGGRGRDLLAVGRTGGGLGEHEGDLDDEADLDGVVSGDGVGPARDVRVPQLAADVALAQQHRRDRPGSVGIQLEVTRGSEHLLVERLGGDVVGDVSGDGGR